MMYQLFKEKKFKDVLTELDSNPKAIWEEYKLQSFGKATLLHLSVLCKATRPVFDKIITILKNDSEKTEEEKKEWVNRKTSASGKTTLHLIMEYCILMVRKEKTSSQNPSQPDDSKNPVPVLISEEWRQILRIFKQSLLFNFNEFDSHGRSILHYVCMKQNYPAPFILHLVTDFGCNPHLLTATGENIFHLCCVKDRHTILSKLILQFWIQPKSINVGSKSSAIVTTEKQSAETISESTMITNSKEQESEVVHLDQPNKDGYTPFHFACSFGSQHCVERLMSFGANVFGVAANTLETGLSLTLKQNNTSLLSLLTMRTNSIKPITKDGQELVENLQRLEKLLTGFGNLGKNQAEVHEKLVKQFTSQEQSSFLKLARMVRLFGFPFEIHEVTTEDGYILHVMHIPHGRIQNQVQDPVHPKPVPPVPNHKPVVFLQHGVMNSGAAWLACGPSNGLGFLLADAGCDVWIGNNRGVQFSRTHKTLSDQDKKYWDFTFHDMGIYDLPAQLNYVFEASGLKQKNDSKTSTIDEGSDKATENQQMEGITYIGHSQGCTQAFIGFSLLGDEFQKKISLMCALAPVSTLQNQQNPLYSLLSTPLFKPDAFMSMIPIWGVSYGEFVASPVNSSSMTQISRSLLPKISLLKPITNNLNFVFNFFMNGHIDKLVYPLLTQHEISPTSTKNMMHWAQFLRHGGFSAFDYGSLKKNTEYYFKNSSFNSTEKIHHPNSRLNSNFGYPVENIKIPVSLFYGEKDDLAAPGDVEKFLIPKLGKNVVYHKLEKGLLHNDFVWGSSDGYEIGKRLFPEIIKQIQAPVKKFDQNPRSSLDQKLEKDAEIPKKEKMSASNTEEHDSGSSEEDQQQEKISNEQHENEDLLENDENKEGNSLLSDSVMKSEDSSVFEKPTSSNNYLIEKKSFLS